MARFYNEYENKNYLPMKPKIIRYFYKYIDKSDLINIENCIADMFFDNENFLNKDLHYWIDSISSISSKTYNDIFYSEIVLNISNRSYIKILKQDFVNNLKGNGQTEVILYTRQNYYTFNKPVKISTLHTLALCYEYVIKNLSNTNFLITRKIDLENFKSHIEENLAMLSRGEINDLNFDIFKFINEDEYNKLQSKCEVLCLEKILKTYDIIPKDANLNNNASNINTALSYANNLALNYKIEKIQSFGIKSFKNHHNNNANNNDFEL